MERRPQEVARRVAGEDPPGPVPAVRRRRETEQQDPRLRVAEPGHRPAPVGLVAEPARPSRAPPARARRRGVDTPGTRRSPRCSAASAARSVTALYLSRSLSIRRDAIASPTMPMIARYATLTSSAGETAPTVSDRMRSTPWYSGVSRTKTWSASGYCVDRVERAREQEHRQDHELDEVEVLPRPHERRRRHADRPEREADEQRRRDGEDRPRRQEQAEDEA